MGRMIVSIAAVVLAILAAPGWAAMAAEDGEGVEHVVVYKEDGGYAGWPANQGMWAWGDEILVGFSLGAHDYDAEGIHPYAGGSGRAVLARSTDGGLTWTKEELNVESEPAERVGKPINFTHPGFALLHQGSGAIVYSFDRGKTWLGPRDGVEIPGYRLRTRNDYLVDGEHAVTAFITTNKANDREGQVAAVRTVDGGLTWEKLSWVSYDPEGFSIMPSSVRLSSAELLTVIREQRYTEDGRTSALAAYHSADDGRTWRQLDYPFPWTTAIDRSSPPALLALDDGRLLLIYAVREKEGVTSRISARISGDGGRSWSGEAVVREDSANRDIGYNEAVLRPDGKVVTAYYYHDEFEPGGSPYRYIAASIFDPDALDFDSGNEGS